jgi:hypothetical protein
MTNANKSVLEIENLESCSFLWGLCHPKLAEMEIIQNIRAMCGLNPDLANLSVVAVHQ